MRITSLQITMIHLTGEQLPIEIQSTTLRARAKRILAAKDELVRTTERDFGYDVLQWHQYLISAQVSEEIRDEYIWGNLHQRFNHWQPSLDWRLAVAEAERLTLEFPNCPHCGSFASLRKVSYGPPQAKEEMWLCSICKERIPIPPMEDSVNGVDEV